MKAFVALLYMLTVDCCWLFHSSSLQLLLNWDQSQRSSFSNLWIPGKYFSLLIFRFVSIEITSYFLLRHASQNYEFQGSISHLTVSYLLQTYCCSQGVSDGKIQITILILRRRPYLVFLTHQFYICIFVTTILLQFCTEPTVFWNCKKGLLLMAFSSKLSTSKHRDSPQSYQYFKYILKILSPRSQVGVGSGGPPRRQEERPSGKGTNATKASLKRRRRKKTLINIIIVTLSWWNVTSSPYCVVDIMSPLKGSAPVTRKFIFEYFINKWSAPAAKKNYPGMGSEHTKQY